MCVLSYTRVTNSGRLSRELYDFPGDFLYVYIIITSNDFSDCRNYRGRYLVIISTLYCTHNADNGAK